MGMFYEREVTVVNGIVIFGQPKVVELVSMSIVPGVPPRPTPGPTPPGELPHPEHPIMLPGMPGWPETPPVPEVPEGKLVYVFAEAPAGEVPPAAPPADAEALKVKYPDGGSGWAWFAPHIAPTK